MSSHIMAVQKQPLDRPFLRLFDPATSEQSECFTLRMAFDEYRWPEIQNKKSASIDGKRWMRLWEEFEAELVQSLSTAAQRTTSPLRCSEVGSREIRAFQMWLAEEGRYPLPKGASSINKAVKEVMRVLTLAAEEGIEVQALRKPKHHKTTSRPRFYYADSAVDRLWSAAAAIDWPPKHYSSPRSDINFSGSGCEPATFWRCLMVILRTYGMRVQDLVAYAAGKAPVLWRDVTFDEASPNPESLERWPLGWIYYRASKTEDSSGREYYLPMTAPVRGAIDRLRAAAFSLHGGTVPLDAPIFACPKSHGLTDTWRGMQAAASVATRTGEHYLLEDFRKTVATYAPKVSADLADALGGWSGGGGIKAKHYAQPEVVLVEQLHRLPVPSCFAEFCDPDQVRRVNEFLASR